jgi:hypothetical protein
MTPEDELEGFECLAVGVVEVVLYDHEAQMVRRLCVGRPLSAQ